MHDDSGEVTGLERPRMALDPDVPEAVGSEARLEHVAVTARHHLVDLAQRHRLGKDREVDVEVRCGQVSLRVEPLAVRQRQVGALRTGTGQPHPPVEVLPEIGHERFPVAHRTHRHRPDLLDPLGWRRDRPDHRDIDVTGPGGPP